MSIILHSKKSNLKSIFSRIVYFTLCFTMIATLCFATGNDLSAPQGAVSNGNSVDDVVDNIENGGGVYATIRSIISILSMVGFIVSGLKLVQIGFMFMMSSATNKKEAKSAMIPWLVGVVICGLFMVIGPWFINLIMGDGGGTGVFDI